MTEKQIEKARKSLKKYEKSEAFKNLKSYCRNKEENIREKIKLGLESWEVSREIQYSTDDVELHKAKILREIAENAWEWAEEFVEFLSDFAKAKEDNIFLSYITNFGYSPCEKKFTEKDLLIVSMWEYRVIHQEQNRLTALIGSMEKQVEKQVEQVYD